MDLLSTQLQPATLPYLGACILGGELSRMTPERATIRSVTIRLNPEARVVRAR